MDYFPLIVVGTYEEFVLGYKVELDDDEKLKLTQNFASHTHQASIRSIATHGKILATAGADEIINIYDMVDMDVTKVINHHESTVTSLKFTEDGSHLITGAQNGSIVTFKCNDWSVVKVWKEAHKGGNGVIETSVHPTGALVISIGSDNVLRFWNLIKGRLAYAVNMSKKLSPGNSLNHAICSKDGRYYVICIGKFLSVYDLETTAAVYTFTCENKISSIDMTKNNIICIGLEDGTLELHKLESKTVVYRGKNHNARVKCIETFNVGKREGEKKQKFLVTADSEGIIHMWRIKKRNEAYNLKWKCSADLGCRITCLSLVSVDVKREPTSNDKTTNQKMETSLNASVQIVNVIEKNKKTEHPANYSQTSRSLSFEEETSKSDEDSSIGNNSSQSKKQKRSGSSVNKTASERPSTSGLNSSSKKEKIPKCTGNRLLNISHLQQNNSVNPRKRKVSYSDNEYRTTQSIKKQKVDNNVERFKKFQNIKKKRQLLSKRSKGSGQWIVESVA